VESFSVEHALAVTILSVGKMVDGFFALLPNLIIGVVVFFVGLQVASLLERLSISVARRARLDETLSQALGSLTKFFTTVMGFLIAATIVIPSFQPGHLIAGLGVTSVAVGFAFKDILQNFFAGLLLLWQKPFKIGDQIKTKEFEGTVQMIDIRSTRIITHSGELVVLPNGDIYTNPIIVNTAFDKRRGHVSVSLPAGMSVENGRKVIRNALKNASTVLDSPEPEMFLGGLDGSDSKFEVYFWTAPKEADVFKANDQLVSGIREGFGAESKITADQAPAPATQAVTTTSPAAFAGEPGAVAAANVTPTAKV
jgi:small conductance mechanosensitive channel